MYNTYSLPEYEMESDQDRFARGAISAAPAIGAALGGIGGGLAGTFLLPGLGTAAGATGGVMIGNAIGNAAQGALPGMLGLDKRDQERQRRNDERLFALAQKQQKEAELTRMLGNMIA